jgi:hypothetical protein
MGLLFLISLLIAAGMTVNRVNLKEAIRALLVIKLNFQTRKLTLIRVRNNH